MSAEQEVKEILAQVAVAPSAKTKENLERAQGGFTVNEIIRELPLGDLCEG